MAGRQRRFGRKGSAGLLQAGKAQAGMFAYGPADDELLGRGGMDGGDFSANFRVRGVAT